MYKPEGRYATRPSGRYRILLALLFGLNFLTDRLCLDFLTDLCDELIEWLNAFVTGKTASYGNQIGRAHV